MNEYVPQLTRPGAGNKYYIISTEEKIWSYLKANGLTDAGAAGLMGNLYAESGLCPTNLQNNYESKLCMTDAEYTAQVDSGSYANFARDGAGYGLAQWTYHTRKAALLEYAKVCKRSIGDLEMQLDFLLHELTASYPVVLQVLKVVMSVRKASDMVLFGFERPADQSETTRARRAGYAQKFFDQYAATKCVQKGSASKMGYTNSPLVSYTRISPNRTPNRNHVIDTISIHCVVGQCSVETLGNIFAPASKQASCNYGIGPDGRIGMYVEEKDRSWCTGGSMRVNGISGSSNDYQAVTIEVASDTTHPYAITDKAMAALIELCADICRRNGIRQLLWQGDKSLVGNVAKQNLTVHRWFANKACPGDYIYNRLGDIAAKVNAKLGTATAAPVAPAAPVSGVPYSVRVSVNDLRIRTGPGTNYNPAGTIKPGVYTIVSEATGAGAKLWGKLKSGAGWIALDYAARIA